MCAIHGITWHDLEAVGLMTAAAASRGPDGSSVWSDGRVSLGHNLLAVADAAGVSGQPWHTSTGTLVFNGEAYNHLDLRRRLDAAFKTDSDTETLAAGLEARGVDFLRSVDGMFALAWYDRHAGRLFLARDPDGSRPLYYCNLPGRRFAFSTEIKSLLSLGLGRVICKEAFRHYYHAGIVSGPLTLFRDVYRVVPGQILSVDLATGVARDVDNLSRRVPVLFGVDPSVRIRDSLSAAVATTAAVRRPACLLLSGGMDSGAVLYEACRVLETPPQAVSTRFELPHHKCRHNEDADVAARLAELYGVSHSTVTVDQAAWAGAVEPALLALEEPRQSKSLPAYHLTMREVARSGAVVVLTGDGGDELLAGYKHHHTPPFLNRLAALRAGRRPPRDPGLCLSLDEQAQYLADWLPKSPLTGDVVNDMLYTECAATLSEDFLVRGDKLGGAFGLEIRFPMMAGFFRDAARGIPGGLKLGPVASWATTGKPLLRSAYRGRLPDWVVDRAKTGWRAPTDDWVVGIASRPAADGPVRQYLRHLLSDPLVRSLFDFDDARVDAVYLNNRDFSGASKPGVGPGLPAQNELFSIAMFAAWRKAFRMGVW